MNVSKGEKVDYLGKIYTVIKVYDNGFCKIGIEKSHCYQEIVLVKISNLTSHL
ncbi:hypothetical protein [Metabacillus sediminilitoris]|uniref:hypothetical protein n=1 Tax=Metabacillus sediminilitoris TaxID=2567941 RepID=UPI0012D73711|nr:hypothetical protein [Metabacillus sediminilitoris]QGQ45533.1 hypothetical protein GMB29_09905 [Metabacillus sediminilitoris]